VEELLSLPFSQPDSGERLLGVVFLKEPMTLKQAIGAVLIIGGGLLLKTLACMI
jgi:drug/metabolite transporter (DMT)-like permease